MTYPDWNILKEEPGKLEHRKSHQKECQIFPSPAKIKHKQSLFYISNDKQQSKYIQANFKITPTNLSMNDSFLKIAPKKCMYIQ